MMVVKEIQGVVLAAGEGTRLAPLTQEKPKGMVEVDGRPILEYCFDDLVELGAIELVVVVGYKKECIIDYFGDSYKKTPITYVHQVEQKGLAHALRRAEGAISGDFMLMLGDIIYEDGTLGNVVEKFQEPGIDGLIITEEVDESEASRYGICEVESGEVVDLFEKPKNPPSNKAITGFYILPEEIIDYCWEISPSDRGEIEITDAISKYISEGGKFKQVPCGGWRVDVGYPEDREKAERLLQREKEKVTTPFAKTSF